MNAPPPRDPTAFAPSPPAGAPKPANEEARLSALRGANLLDTLPEKMFDDVVKVASAVCGTPIALVSLVDSERQWFKAVQGLDAKQTPREQAFCAHAILEPGKTMVVPDATADARFVDNPLVTGGPNIRLYAGAPVVTHSGHPVGTVCVIDTVPRELTAEQIECLEALSRQVSNLIEFRRLSRSAIDSAQLQLLAKSDRLRTVQAQNDSLKARVAELEAALEAQRKAPPGSLRPSAG